MDPTRTEAIYNYRKASNSLLTSGQPTEQQLVAASHEGVRVVINLAMHDDPRYSLPDERATVEAAAMAYIHIPVRFDAPAEHDLLAFFAALDASKPAKTLVHCAANMRVTAFLGLYRVIRERQPPDEAFALMKTVWEPNAVWSAFIASMLEKSGVDEE